MQKDTELARATMDLQKRVKKILEDAQREGTDFNKYPKLALVVVKKNLKKRIQNHKIMQQVDMKKLIIFVLDQMNINVTGENMPLPVQEEVANGK